MEGLEEDDIIVNIVPGSTGISGTNFHSSLQYMRNVFQGLSIFGWKNSYSMLEINFQELANRGSDLRVPPPPCL